MSASLMSSSGGLSLRRLSVAQYRNYELAILIVTNKLDASGFQGALVITDSFVQHQ